MPCKINIRKCPVIILSLIILCLSCKPRDFDNDLRAAEAKLGQGDNDGAIAEYLGLAKRYPDDPRRPGILLSIALLYETIFNDDKLAAQGYKRLISEYPFSEAAITGLERHAHLMEKAGEIDRAIEDYSALLKHFPDHANRHKYRLMLAGAYLAQRNFVQARIETSPLLNDKQIPPDVYEHALFIVAESLFLEDRHADAVPYYQELIKNFPKSELAGEAALHLATCAEEMGYLGPARDITKEAGNLYPNKKVIDTRLKSIRERGTKK